MFSLPFLDLSGDRSWRPIRYDWFGIFSFAFPTPLVTDPGDRSGLVGLVCFPDLPETSPVTDPGDRSGMVGFLCFTCFRYTFGDRSWRPSDRSVRSGHRSVFCGHRSGATDPTTLVTDPGDRSDAHPGAETGVAVSRKHVGSHKM